MGTMRWEQKMEAQLLEIEEAGKMPALLKNILENYDGFGQYVE